MGGCVPMTKTSVLIEEVRRYLFGSFERVCSAKVESIFNLDKK